ncbi:response regulator [Paenibacillus gansuensis]|uniref:Response regulator n=1 Tax=Paenibacillus gansuensis TaxID=306542 RepID=A0ABW5PAT9_9BACL
MNLLIVDDEISVIEGLLGTIEWSGIGFHTVRSATSAFEAIRLMEEETVDVVITDIRMPEMSGLELVQAIEERWDKTKCILLTGHKEFHYAQSALRRKVFDYILKPASDEEIICTVTAAVDAIHNEWNQASSMQKAMYTLREHLPVLRGNLLLKLLHGQYKRQGDLELKFNMLELPFTPKDRVVLLLVRLDTGVDPEDPYSLQLYEYAIINMAEEVFNGGFSLWSTRDVHDYLVIALKQKEPAAEFTSAAGAMENLSVKLQECIQQYLKLLVTVVLSRSAALTDDLSDAYNGALSYLRKYGNQGTALFLSVSHENKDAKVGSLKTPYQSPTLLHLLEAGKWDEAEIKVKDIWLEVASSWEGSEEHIMEAVHGIIAAFTCIAHHHGRHLSEIISSEYGFLWGQGLRIRTKAEEWTLRALRSIRDDIWEESRHNRNHMVRQIQDYIVNHLSEDLSLTALASLVYIHPAYLSRLFKDETGGGVSDYILRLRMEHATYLLKHTNLKVYEVAKQTGYQNVAYFIKVFRTCYNQTPQEYKDRSCPVP